MSWTYYEFFAGGGMARAGLGTGWQCLFANDIDPLKADSYSKNWGGDELWVGDIGDVRSFQVPDRADLAWASFPCQDLSLAGTYQGLSGLRSGTFWAFWRLIQTLRVEGRAPRLIVLENVVGALTSHGGRDFGLIGDALADAGYEFGAMIIDARLFLPQSRPRLFVIAADRQLLGRRERAFDPIEPWHTKAVRTAQDRLSAKAKKHWVWWSPPAPVALASNLREVLEEEPSGVVWNSPEETDYLLSLMTSVHLTKIEDAKSRSLATGIIEVGGIYRRTRAGQQRAEVRFDGVAGCLRTPAGGSSRQTLIIVDGKKVRTRLLSTREAARLMGLPDSYKLPTRYNQAYHLAGDGVVVPAVRHIAETILEPELRAALQKDVPVVAAQ